MSAISDVKAMPGDAHGIKRPNLDLPIDMKTILVFCAILAGGLFFAAYSISQDVTAAGTAVTTRQAHRRAHMSAMSKAQRMARCRQRGPSMSAMTRYWRD